MPWWQVFEDPALQGLLRDAVAHNLDLRLAVARVQEARAIAGVAEVVPLSRHQPVGRYTGNQASRNSQPPAPRQDGDRTYNNTSVAANLSWEADLFGRLRRNNEAAFARYLATEEGRRAVLVTLVSDVASAYFLLQELDLQLEIARRTLVLNDQTVVFYTDRLDGGVSNRLELDQAKANRALTAAAIPELERQIAHRRACDQRARRAGAGRHRARPDARRTRRPPVVPVGVPASLLERRPDVIQAERQLVAANADVGAAKALFYPTISLTGALGTVSGDLGDFLKGDSLIWSVGAGLFQPLFNANRIKRNFEAAQARFDQAVVGLPAVGAQRLPRSRRRADHVAEAGRDARRAGRGRRGAARRRGALATALRAGPLDVPRSPVRRPGAVPARARSWRARVAGSCAWSRSCIAPSAAAGRPTVRRPRHRPPPPAPPVSPASP